jgi:zinc protease
MHALLGLALIATPALETSVEGINAYTLPNGMKVLTFVDDSKPTVTVNVTYFVGSRNEDYGETGMAHLLEHLLFKGTPTTPNVPQVLTEHGAKANGTTWLDRTNYYETIPATPENVEWAIRFEADRMVNSNIAKKDLDSEMTVVRNEFEAGENSPRGVLLQRVLSSAFLWHNYGAATIGARSDIEKVPIERLQGFYKRYYQPDNAMLIVAGRFDEKKTLALVEQTFGKIAKPTRQIYPTYTREPTQDGERSVTLRRVGDVQQVATAYHVPAGSHADFAPVDVLARTLGATPSGRLYKALVEGKKAVSVAGFDFQLKEPGVLIFMAEVRKEQSIDAARDLVVKSVEDRKPFTDEEVERAKTELLKGIDQVRNVSERLALQLSEWAAMGDWRLFFIHRDRLRQVSAADVNRVAAAYLKPANRTSGVFIPTEKPDRAEIPEASGLDELVKSYKGEAAVAAGEAFDSSPMNIDKRTVRTKSKGGVQLALLQKKTRAELVSLALTMNLGNEKALMDKDLPGSLAGAMLMRGTKKHTREQLKDAFDKLKAQVSVGGEANYCRVNVEVEKKHLAATLELLTEVLREPRFDAKELDELVKEQLASFEEQRRQPQALASTAFSKQLNPWPKGHPFYALSADEAIAELKKVKLEQVSQFYKDFYGTESVQVAAVGDFDDTVVRAFVERTFDGWKAKTKYERIAQPFKKIAPAAQTIQADDKANAMFLAGMKLELKDSDPDYPALVLGNYIFGGGFLNSRLATRLRQKEGTSYGVGSSVRASPIDANGTFTVYAIYAPENVAKVEAGLKEELARALKDGFTDDELKNAKSGWLEGRQVGRAQDGSVAGALTMQLYLDRTMAFDAELEAKVAALDAKTIVAALQKRISYEALSSVRAGDFSKLQIKAAKAE